jgi:hypothetical protein
MEYFDAMCDPDRVVEADFARKLERERDEAREYADKLVAHKDMVCLPKDLEVLREANLGLAMELNEARATCSELVTDSNAITLARTAVRITQERDQARRERDEWKAKYIQQNKDLGCEMMDPNGTIWDYAKWVQSELTVVKKQLDQLEGKICFELGGHPDSKLWGDAGLIAATMRCVDALDTVTEQRDRLLKHLNVLAYWRDISECDCHNPLPNGGCLRCDLDKVFNSNQQPK